MKTKLQSLIFAVIITLFIIIFFSGCVFFSIDSIAGNRVTAKGSQETYQIDVGQFNRIRIEGQCDVRYYSAFSETVTLEIQQNVREYFIVEVQNNVLIIRSTRNISFASVKSPVLTVSTPILNRVSIQGAGSFTALDKITADSLDFLVSGASTVAAELDVKRLSVNVSGAGNLNLSGEARTANFVLSGAGYIRALELQTADSTIVITGAGTVNISCSDNLSINASGAGSVRYRGSPIRNVTTIGVFSVSQVN